MAHEAKMAGLCGDKMYPGPIERVPVLANFRFSAWLTYMGITYFKLALVDFPNVIGPKGANCDSETCHFALAVTLKKMYPSSYRRFFRSVCPWD